MKLSTVALPLPDDGQTNFSRLKPRRIEILARVYSNALALLQHLCLACRQRFLFLQCCRWGLKAFGSLREYSSTRKSVSRSLSKYYLCVLRSWERWMVGLRRSLINCPGPGRVSYRGCFFTERWYFVRIVNEYIRREWQRATGPIEVQKGLVKKSDSMLIFVLSFDMFKHRCILHKAKGIHLFLQFWCLLTRTHICWTLADLNSTKLQYGSWLKSMYSNIININC